MPIIVSNIRVSIDTSDKAIINLALNKVNANNVKNAYIYKKSLDARRKDIFNVCSVIINLTENEAEIAKAISDPFVYYKELKPLDLSTGDIKPKGAIAVIGFGPAGIFASHILAKLNYKPIIFERGSCIEDRTKNVDTFIKTRKLNANDNIQFGEGGAGTFSDGKLTTRISDSRCSYVLEQFNKHGASSEILYNAKPHIGTDVLRNVIKSMREEILLSGGEIHFNSLVTDINISNGKVKSIISNNIEYEVEAVILAVGHSARDTFKMIDNSGVPIFSKPFAVGVRIEQLQSDIDNGLHVKNGEYQLSSGNVYTFCMCPGGYVMAATSEEECVVVNGMSYHARDGKNANSALVTTVDAFDNPFDGIEFQRELEKKAFIAGGSNYSAPCTSVKGFINDKPDLNGITPTYPLGVKACNFNDVLPNNIIKNLKNGLNIFEKKLNGFSKLSGMITGVETRTSSPIRIERNEELLSVDGLYPCGEGAGYAGGIMSAAVDGIKVAQAIASKYKPF